MISICVLLVLCIVLLVFAIVALSVQFVKTKRELAKIFVYHPAADKALLRVVESLQRVINDVRDESTAVVEFTAKLTEICNDVLNNKK